MVVGISDILPETAIKIMAAVVGLIEIDLSNSLISIDGRNSYPYAVISIVALAISIFWKIGGIGTIIAFFGSPCAAGDIVVIALLSCLVIKDRWSATQDVGEGKIWGVTELVSVGGTGSDAMMINLSDTVFAIISRLEWQCLLGKRWVDH